MIPIFKKIHIFKQKELPKKKTKKLTWKGERNSIVFFLLFSYSASLYNPTSGSVPRMDEFTHLVIFLRQFFPNVSVISFVSEYCLIHVIYWLGIWDTA